MASSASLDLLMQEHKGLSKKIEIPRSVPGLVTRQLLVMNFLDGTQITRLGDKVHSLSKRKRKMAMDKILHRVAEAYGRQLLYGGLFQADGHPGNILVMKGEDDHAAGSSSFAVLIYGLPTYASTYLLPHSSYPAPCHDMTCNSE